MTNTKDTRAPRALKGLGLAAIAAALLSLGSIAHADVFGGQANNQINDQVLQRMSALEAELRLLKESGLPTPNGPGNLDLAVMNGGAPVPPPAVVPKTYRVVGEINGRLLIRAGTARLLLTKEELEKFDREEQEKAQQAASGAALPGAAGNLSLPPPPVPPVKAATTQALPAGPSTAPAAAPARSAAPARPVATPNKPAAAKPAQPAQARN